jgi:hypothetical protein
MKLRDILNNLILENSSYFKELESNWKRFGQNVSIPSNYQVFKKKKKIPGLKNRLCYLNSLNRAKENTNVKLAIGLMVANKPNSQGYIDKTFHAWNVVNGVVEDCTMGNYSGGIYIGRIIDNIENLKDGSDVRDLLFNDLGIN